MRPATLQDIAQAAGLSVSAVSQALRDRPNIPATTRAKVRTVAEKLGYRPDPLLSALAARRRGRAKDGTANLALLSVSETELQWSQHWARKGLLQGARRRAAELGFTLDYMKIGMAAAYHARIPSIFRARGISGYLLDTFPHSTRELQLPWTAMPPGVSLYCQPYGAPIPCVVSNHVQSMHLCCENARNRGYKRLGLVLPCQVAEVTQRDWIGAFMAWSEGASGAILEVDIESATRDVVSSEFDRTVMTWFQKLQPDAILFCNGPRLPATLKRNGVACPRDVALCDLDQIDLTSEVTGINQGRQIVAAAAIDFLHGLIATHRTAQSLPQSLQIEGAWHEGRTMPQKSN